MKHRLQNLILMACGVISLWAFAVNVQATEPKERPYISTGFNDYLNKLKQQFSDGAYINHWSSFLQYHQNDQIFDIGNIYEYMGENNLILEYISPLFSGIRLNWDSASTLLNLFREEIDESEDYLLKYYLSMADYRENSAEHPDIGKSLQEAAHNGFPHAMRDHAIFLLRTEFSYPNVLTASDFLYLSMMYGAKLNEQTFIFFKELQEYENNDISSIEERAKARLSILKKSFSDKIQRIRQFCENGDSCGIDITSAYLVCFPPFESDEHETHYLESEVFQFCVHQFENQ